MGKSVQKTNFCRGIKTMNGTFGIINQEMFNFWGTNRQNWSYLRIKCKDTFRFWQNSRLSQVYFPMWNVGNASARGDVAIERGGNHAHDFVLLWQQMSKRFFPKEPSYHFKHSPCNLKHFSRNLEYRFSRHLKHPNVKKLVKCVEIANISLKILHVTVTVSNITIFIEILKDVDRNIEILSQ